MFRTILLNVAMSTSLLVFAGMAAAQSLTDLYPLAPETEVTALGAQAGQLKGLAVNGAEGGRVGQVTEALGTEGGTPTAVAVDFTGSAFGERKGVIVSLADMRLAEGALTLSVEPRDVADFPLYEPKEPLPPGGAAE